MASIAFRPNGINHRHLPSAKLPHPQLDGDLCYSFRCLVTGHVPTLLQEAYRLLPFPGPHNAVQLHLPFGIDPWSSRVKPFDMDFARHHPADENPPSVIRV